MAGDPLKKGRYTNYGNKIGLFSNKTGNFISNSPEIVLNFPFKDTVLEAGMTKEDAGREERFLHIEMDAKDIDTLEDPKVLTNFKYIDQSGEHDLDGNSDIEFFDENGELKQNLLIKGNNLLALYTLREKLAGKVKLIYIDPPYNTGNDGFRYNDSFNHSSWLVFMKNRLEVAKELLAKDGVILIQCDDNEQAYLKVLMDEIFTRENFVATITRVTKKGGNKGDFVKPKNDFILMYFNDMEEIDKKTYGIVVGKNLQSANWLIDENMPNDTRKFIRGEIPYRAKLDSRPNQRYYIECPDGSLIIPRGTVFPNEKVDAAQVKPLSNNDKCWTWSAERYREEKKNNRFYFYKTATSPFLDENGKQSKWSICKKIFEEEYKDNKKEILSSYIEVNDFIDDSDNAVATRESDALNYVFSFPKPEKLLQYLIDMTTQPGNIVLDYQ